MKPNTYTTRVRSQNNITISKLEKLDLDLDLDDITEVLFKGRKNSEIKKSDKELTEETKDITKFWIKFLKYKELLKKQKLNYDFSYIIFPLDHNKQLKIMKYECETNFSNCIFTDSIDFSDVIFEEDVNFSNSIFSDEANFNSTIYKNNADFSEIMFEADTYFSHALFQSHISFENTECEGIFDFSDTAFSSLLLDKSSLPNASYLRLNGYDKKTYIKEGLSDIHIKTKETARIIKAHFDTQNNITEANKYFPIEQELYLNTIYSQESIIPNKNSTLFVLLLNKLVNYFGTDWVRSLLMLFMLSYLFMRFYIDFDSYLGTDKHIKHFIEIADIQYIWTMFISWGLIYLSTFYKANKLIFWSLILIGVVINIIGITSYDNVLAMQNYIIQLTNPINAFKNMDLYEGIEIYGAFVRIIIVTIIYQFLVAFRQNTRRK